MMKKILGVLVLITLTFVQVRGQKVTWEGTVSFTHNKPNEVAYIEMADITMTVALEVTIFGNWNYSPSFGKITKLFSFYHPVGKNIVSEYNSEVVTAHGKTVETYGIGEVRMVDNKVRIPIYKLNTYSGTSLYVHVAIYSTNASSVKNALSLIETISKDIGPRLQNEVAFSELKVGDKDIPDGFKLAVAGNTAIEGTLKAKEIKVQTDVWADHVFKEPYNLRSLKEVENFIQENRHLPDIPSEEEVEKEGISVGEMNAKLLQKIEEMTLYLLNQHKSMQVQNEKMKQMEEQLVQQQEMLLELQKRLGK
jgi:hypothetical protein